MVDDGQAWWVMVAGETEKPGMAFYRRRHTSNQVVFGWQTIPQFYQKEQVTH